MYILIVDDEYYARKATVKIVKEWDDQAEIEEAENGQDALEAVTRRMPDLLLVDVRMPEMDGIELCRRLRALSEDVDIVIISGYADFSYAQQAIHFRVEQYILKPVFPQSLCEALERSRTAYRLRHERHKKDRKEKEIRTLVRLIDGERTISDRDEDALFAWRHYRVWVARLAESEPEQHEAQYRELIDALDRIEGAIAFAHAPYSNEIVMLQRGMDGARKATDDALVHLRRLRETGALRDVWAIGQGEVVTDYRDLAASYRTAVRALGLKLLNPDLWVAAGAEVEKGDYTISRVMDALAERLAHGEIEQAAQLLRSRLAQPGYTLRGLDEDYHYLLNAIVRAGYRLGIPGWSRRAEQISMMRLCDFDTLEELAAYLEMCMRKLATDEAERRSDGVEQTLDYIRAHYSEDLRLTDIAKDVVFVNACYLSRCIKAKTGKSFSALLQAERMLRARDLLDAGGFSVSAVAAMVGYNKVSYFIEVYKRTFGATPGKDRRG